MARTYKLHSRAPHTPHRCMVCNVVPSEENLVVDLDKQIDYYGMVYICYRCLVGITAQLGFTTPDETTRLKEEVESLRTKINRIPAITERLVNDIRDISLSVSANLLSEHAPVVLVDDQKPEQSNSGVNADYFGDDTPVEPSSESTVSEGPDSLPADTRRNRSTNTRPRTSTANNG